MLEGGLESGQLRKPATGKSQTKFFYKRDSVSRSDKRLVSVTREFEQ